MRQPGVRTFATQTGVVSTEEIKAAQVKPLWENADHTAILLTLEDKGVPGILNQALSVFQDFGINLTSV